MSHEFINNGFIPDFYLIGPHGVGTLSFGYYLSWLGTPTSCHDGIYENGKKSPLLYPVPKSPYIYARGVSIDRVILDSPPLAYGNEDQKVIQLIRDPVDQLTSLINWFITTCVYGGGVNITVLDNSMKLDFINTYITWSCMFTSIRNNVASKNRTLFFDANDLKEKNCINTMHIVSEYLNVPYNYDLDTVCKISYNSFTNRMWRWQSLKSYAIGANTYIGQISVYPSHLHDFGANQWERAHILDIFSYNGEEYTVSMPERYFYERGKITNKNVWDESKRESMKRVLDIWMAHMEVTERLYQQYAMTWEDTVALIRSNPRFHKRFMRLMEHEISLPLKEVPEKVERWAHFHSL